MPSEKRQRQDQGRLLRLEEERSAQQRARKRSSLKWFVLAVLGVVAIGVVIALLPGKDDDKDVATVDATTTTTADGETGPTTPPGDPAIGTTACPPADGSATRTTTFESGPKACIDVTKTYLATIETSKGTFTVDLDPTIAPKAVNSFVFLSRYHYYDGVTFHRIIPGFVVQGGDANGDPPGTGGPGYEFADELPTGDAPFYEIGSLAMANSGPDTNGSQFYIVTGDQGTALPASYTLFGKVHDGMDVVQKIEATGTAEGTPTETTTITSVTITES